MIPFYVMGAHGGKVLTVDDPAVVNDLCDLDGTGGAAFQAPIRTGPIRPRGMTFGKARRLLLRVPHDGAVAVDVAVVRDGQEGAALTRELEAGDRPSVVVPLSTTGGEFALDITLRDWDAACSLSDGVLYVLPRQRAG